MKAVLQNNSKKKSQVILKRVSTGDKSAVEDFVNAYGNVIWALAKKSTETAEDAENVVLEIFRDIWKYAARFETVECDEIKFVALIAHRRLNIRRKKFAASNF